MTFRARKQVYGMASLQGNIFMMCIYIPILFAEFLLFCTWRLFHRIPDGLYIGRKVIVRNLKHPQNHISIYYNNAPLKWSECINICSHTSMEMQHTFSLISNKCQRFQYVIQFLTGNNRTDLLNISCQELLGPKKYFLQWDTL